MWALPEKNKQQGMLTPLYKLNLTEHSTLPGDSTTFIDQATFLFSTQRFQTFCIILKPPVLLKKPHSQQSVTLYDTE